MGNFDRTSWFYTIFKMEVTTWLSLLLAVIALGSTASASEPRVVCYYTNWSVYRPGTARFNPQNINPYLCTHLVYAFGGFTKENTFKPFDKYQDIEKGGYAKFTGLKTYNKNLKTMLAIGGWNEGSSRFSPMVGSRERRKEFVRNAIKFLRQNRFDGLDLDWEYPAFRDGGKPKDRENYAKLVKELREQFDRESEKTGKPRLLLTMAVPAGIEYIQKGFDVKTLNQYLDWMNLLSYDYHSAFEPAVNHHAPLYPLEEPNEYSVDNELNIDYTIKFYIEAGADPSKLVLGIPTYGRSYTLFNPDAVEIGSPADGPGEQGDATREKGYLAYYEICESLNKKTKKRRQASEEDSEEYSEEEEEDEEWTVMHPNPDAMGPVAFKGNQWVGYDDVDIVRKKAEYVAENGLGGIMFWSIDNDDFRGACHGKPYPLIEAAKESYFAKLGSTDVREKVQTSTRRKSRPRSSTTTTTTPKPASKSNRRKPATTSVTSTTPAWNIITPEPPTTPDPGSDFKCTDEGFYPHPRDCKKYFWCLDSGPSNLGIVAHSFTCPSGLFFNKAADSCDFARNVLCKIKDPPTKAPTTRAPTTKAVTTTTTTTTTRKPIRLSTKSSSLFRTTSTTTPEPEEEEYEDESREEPTDEDAEDPRVLKELIDLIKKVGGIEQLEKQLRFGENNQASTDGGITTTPSPYKKKLYQKVLERTRGQNRYTGPNSILESSGQNSRRGPQNAGIEPSSDKDKLIRKDRPQYTTINRQRGSKPTEATPESEEDEDESEEEDVQQIVRAKSVDTESRVGTTTKPLQYVNIRRARPTTSDTADDTASRNALFERSEPFVSVSDTPNKLDILSARRENQPEYVTIRRQRPTTQETTTVQYQNSDEEEELQETALEREISTQPQYTSIVRSRSTSRPVEEPSSEAPVLRVRSTTVATEETSSPDPTTVLSVQISSLLNSPNSAEIETPETEAPAPTTVVETTTPTTTTTTITTTTTPAPPSIPTRRTLIRRRGSTTPSPSTAAPSSTTQVSARNYAFVSRRRPLSRPNEISSDSDDSAEVSRKIRSTTPDSREVDEPIPRETGPVGRRFRSRFQSSQTARSDDSIPAAASPVSRGSFKPQVVNPDEVISLTPIDVEPQFVPRQVSSFSTRTDRRFRRPLASTASDTDTASIPDSEGSAATVETSRPNLLPRGRSRFTVSTTTESTDQPASVSFAQRRPTFARFTPRPFTRPSPSSTVSPDAEDDENTEAPEENTTPQRIAPRLPFGRSRPTSTVSPRIIARKLPFPSRQSTTQQTLSNDDDDDDEPEGRIDDILLSESAREEKEHEDDEESEVTEEAPKRRVIIKKFRTPDAADSDTVPTETVPIDDSGKKRFRVIRRRPTSTTAAPEPVVTTEAPTAPGPQRIRKIIRKKLKPAEGNVELTAKSVGSLNTFRSTTPEELNYGEKTRPTTTTTETVTEPIIEEVTEFYKEKKVKVELQSENVETKEEVTEKVIEKEEEKQVQQAVEQTTVAVNTVSKANDQTDELQNTENNQETVTEAKSAVTEAITDSDSKTTGENKESSDKSEGEIKVETDSQPATEEKSEVTVISEGKSVDISENKNTTGTESTVTETDDSQTETTTVSTTVSTTSTSRTRLPYRPRKKLYTPSTESSVPSTTRVFSRKYNPGVYTSPATADRPLFRPSGSTRRPFSSKLFTRKPFTPRTTQRFEDDEEYNDEELLEEDPESENPFVFVPPNQLFTRKPDSEEEGEEAANSEELLDEEEEGHYDEEAVDEDEKPTKFSLTTRRPGFRPRLINSNTFRTTTSTTELPKRLSSSQNRTGIITRFSNKPAVDGKKRVQNVPPGYNSPVAVPRPKGTGSIIIRNGTQAAETESNDLTTTNAAVTDGETTTSFDDDYLTVTSTTDGKEPTTPEDASTTNTDEMETATYQMEVDNSTDDYLESTEGTTSYPTTQDITTISQTEPEVKTTIVQNTVVYTIPNTETTTEQVPTNAPTTTTTESSPPPPPIIKTQFDKLFSITRIVEVNSKLDKHHINKNNETTHIEEGKIMVEKKPVVDKIGEVSRFTLIKIVEDDIPIYLTKYGHIYPVEHPPENHIRIDEARNARALVETYPDAPRENLVASESVNEAYRHIKPVSDSKADENKDRVEHLPSDDFLSYVNEENKTDEEHDGPLFASWQFVPAAYEDEKAAKRNFLRRTKATAPPDTTETESATDKIETTTNKFTRRGNSKFKSRKEAELAKKGATAKNEVENASRRPTFNGGVRRTALPTRKFVRVRPGGANATTTSTAAPLSPSPSSTLVTRRPFRVTSRRRILSSTTTTTTTTAAPTTTAVPTTAAPQAVTNVYEDEESLQDIGDIDAIEDPTLEPKSPKKTNKVQRRPLVNLKDDTKDQNPSATNEEENKRQSKKYSASIKQNQLNDLLKLKSQEETSTERKTTAAEDISAETALAIAAHQLITAPIPNLTDFEEDVKPTRKTQTTVEYKYTSREYNEYTDISRTPTYDEYQSTPVYRGTVNFDQTTSYKNPTNYDTTKVAADFDTTKIATDFDTTKTATDFDTARTANEFDTTKVATDYEAPKYPTTSTIYKTDYTATTSNEPFTSEFDAPKISTTTYDVPKSTAYPNTVNTANTANLEFIRTNPNDYTLNTNVYEPPKLVTPTYSPRSPSTNYPNTETNPDNVRTTFGGAYDRQTDFYSKNTYLPKATATNFPTNTVPSEFTRTTANTYLDTSTELISKTSPTYVPKFPTTDFQNTINQEFVRTTLNSYDNTQTELNAPKISSTLAPVTSTRYFERTTFADTPTENSQRSAFVPKSTATTKFSRSGSRFSLALTSVAPTGYTGVQRSSTQRYRTEKLIPVPVENTGYSTVSYTGPSQEPAYFTREYLLESPVTKTYDEEYQYLSPVTTPQTPATSPTRKVIRKKIQRRISTTLRPTEAPSSTTPVPRRMPSKQPFEKIAKVPKKTYRPIVNYDYYDDSDEKVAVKYVEGTKIVMRENGQIECLDIGNFPHPKSCKKFISCARIDNGSLLGWEYVCPKGLSFDPVGGICNWSAGLGCDEKDA